MFTNRKITKIKHENYTGNFRDEPKQVSLHETEAKLTELVVFL